MTNSESVHQLGNNAYAKPATALNILRETVLGRELFDFAFREYSHRWKFKRPYPADFFRTMEDASGVDLDWFWHGWFYTTNHVDFELTNVRHYTLTDGDPAREAQEKRAERNKEPETLSAQRNKALPKLVDAFPNLKDFYNSFDDLNVSEQDKQAFEKLMADLKPDEKKLLETKSNFYIVDLKNIGGLVMPVILKVTYHDDTSEVFRYPAELWLLDSVKCSKLIITQKTVKSVELDPYLEIADVDRSNNYFPPQIQSSRFKVFRIANSHRTKCKKPDLAKRKKRRRARSQPLRRRLSHDSNHSSLHTLSIRPVLHRRNADGRSGAGRTSVSFNVYRDGMES